MDTIKPIIYAMFRGALDSIRGSIMLFTDKGTQYPVYLNTKKSVSGTDVTTLKEKEKSKLVKRVIECCLLNGGIFLLSILIFEHMVIPVLRSLLYFIFPNDSAFGMWIWSWVKPFISFLFGMCWILPLFVLSKIVNALWFQDIADSAYRYTRGRPQLIPSLSRLLSDTLFSLVVQAFYLVQCVVTSRIPIAYFGKIFNVVQIAMLYSLYSFEYKWINMGMELHIRLSLIETNWPYFIGFGLPLAVMTELPNSYLISGCVFAILFPLFIISGNNAEPVYNSCAYPLKLFSLVIAMANTVFKSTIKVPKSHKTPGR